MNVNAIQSMMANRNQLFRQIFGEESTNPDREKKITAEDIGRGSGDIWKSCVERDEDDDLQRLSDQH